MTERAALIGGTRAADELVARIALDVAQFTRASGITPGLAIVALAGEPVQDLYVRKKIVQCERAGIRPLEHRVNPAITTAQLEELVCRLNGDPEVHGIFVQWPMPECVDLAAVARAIAPSKDIDGMGSSTFPPAAVRACQLLLRDTIPSMAGHDAVIAGGSEVFAKAIARILLDEKCRVTLAHRSNDDLPAICSRGDILIAAVGAPGLIRGDWIKPGAVIIDVGNNVVAGYDGSRRYVGDVKFEEAVWVARAITPVPGGVGPMTIATLLEHTLAAAMRHLRAGG